MRRTFRGLASSLGISSFKIAIILVSLSILFSGYTRAYRCSSIFFCFILCFFCYSISCDSASYYFVFCSGFRWFIILCSVSWSFVFHCLSGCPSIFYCFVIYFLLAIIIIIFSSLLLLCYLFSFVRLLLISFPFCCIASRTYTNYKNIRNVSYSILFYSVFCISFCLGYCSVLLPFCLCFVF